MIEIVPDPAHPLGGYALFRVDAAAAPGPEVSISIRNSFNDKFLGEDGWQPGRVYFGPYAVKAEGDRAEFVVGIEIVNQVEEYTPIVVTVGERDFETSWPDDIAQGPAAATVGGMSATPPKAAGAAGPTLVGKAGAPAEEPAPDENAPAPEEPAPSPKPGPQTGQQSGPKPAPTPDPKPRPEAAEGTGGSRAGFIAVGVLVVLAAAGLAFWLLDPFAAPKEEPVAQTPVREPEPVAAAEPPADPCSEAALRSVAGEGIGVLMERLGSCGGAASVDAAFGLIEDGVDAGQAAALATMGRLYDAEQEIAGVESALGLTFADNPARAAEYYARAVAAGDGSGAAEALAAVCDRLAARDDTLSVGALQDHCPE